VLKLHRITPELVWAKDPMAKFCCWGKTIQSLHPPSNDAGTSHVLTTFQNGPILFFVGVMRHRNLQFQRMLDCDFCGGKKILKTKCGIRT
jgi:hypothetical protein